MGIVDIFKNRAIKKEDKSFEDEKNKIYTNWNNLIFDYNGLMADRDHVFQGNVEWNKIRQNIDGAKRNVGLSKTTFSQEPKQSNLYEFLLIKPQPDGQVDSAYYGLTHSGNLQNDRGLGTLHIKYIANVNGRQIPCIANIVASTQDLADVKNMVIKPEIVPATPNVDSQLCAPDISDIYNIVANFALLNERYVHHIETTADFMPGGR